MSSRALGADEDLKVLPSLDGLRALAVSLVVLYHFGIPGVNGGLGVLMFFVLSGFLITHLLLKEEARYGDISLRLFYVRRTLRIFPAFYAYWLLVVVGFGVILGKRIVWPQAWASLTYTSNYFQAIFGDPNTGLSHTWSLAVEEQFYLLWPMAFIALRNNARRLRVLQIAIICLWVYRLALVTAGVSGGYIYEALDTRADHLLIGCLLAVLWQEGRLSDLLAAHSKSIHLTLALLAASSVMPIVFNWRYRDTAGFILDPLLTAVLIVQAVKFQPRWMNWGPVSLIGRMSYSIYLYQQIAIDPAKKLLSAYPVWVQFPAAITCVMIAAAFSYYVIERPFLQLKDRWGKRSARPEAQNGNAISAVSAAD